MNLIARMRTVVRSGRCLLTACFLVVGVAEAQVVVVGGRSMSEMSREQVADIFLGKSTALPGGGVALPVDQPESSPAREDFYGRVTGKSAAQARSLWSRLAFTGKGMPPKVIGDSAEVKKYVAGTTGAIGYIDRSAVDDSVKVILNVQQEK